MIVNTKSFRLALRAVLPHICTDDDIPSLTVARVISEMGGVQVVATDRYTAAMARVECPSLEPMTFDLTAEQIRKVLTMFKPTKDMEESAELSIELGDDGKTVVITDVCGMFPGDSMTFGGVAPADGFPDVPRLVQTVTGAALTDKLADVNPAFLARLKAAEGYGPLTMAHGDKALWFVTEMFTCVISTARPSDA